MDLKGKVALVTGGASGHGKEYCKELFKQGCKVLFCSVSGLYFTHVFLGVHMRHKRRSRGGFAAPAL